MRACVRMCVLACVHACVLCPRLLLPAPPATLARCAVLCPLSGSLLQARTGKLKPRALRHLAAEYLGLTIQVR